MSELSRPRGSEGYGACSDDARRGLPAGQVRAQMQGRIVCARRRLIAAPTAHRYHCKMLKERMERDTNEPSLS